jgi:hypothetical protein
MQQLLAFRGERHPPDTVRIPRTHEQSPTVRLFPDGQARARCLPGFHHVDVAATSRHPFHEVGHKRFKYVTHIRFSVGDIDDTRRR